MARVDSRRSNQWEGFGESRSSGRNRLRLSTSSFGFLKSKVVYSQRCMTSIPPGPLVLSGIALPATLSMPFVQAQRPRSRLGPGPSERRVGVFGNMRIADLVGQVNHRWDGVTPVCSAGPVDTGVAFSPVQLTGNRVVCRDTSTVDRIQAVAIPGAHVMLSRSRACHFQLPQ